MNAQDTFILSAKKTSRLAWMDYAKGIAILMVVARHVTIGMDAGGVYVDNQILDILKNGGLTFRMPLFFLLSGVFFRQSILKRSQSGYISHKAVTILYPYLIWSFILTSLQMLMAGYINTTVNMWSYLNIFIDPWGHWWFLVALFNVSILYLGLNRLFKSKKYLLLLAGLIMYFTADLLVDYSIAFHIMRLFIFFVAGDLVSKYIQDKKIKGLFSSGWIFVLALICAGAGEWILFSEQDPWRNGTLLMLLCAFVGSFVTLLVSYRLHTFNSPYFSFLRTVGQYSLYVYLLHTIIGAGIRVVFANVLGISNYWVILAVSVSACLFVPIYFYKACKLYGAWFLFSPQPPLKPVMQKSVNTEQTLLRTKYDPNLSSKSA